MPQLLTLVAQIGNKTAAMKVMPWVMDDPRSKKSNATAAEVADAEAELEAGIVFS